MADRKTVNVGVFAERRADGQPIPSSMVGRRIYYNYDREFFIITDENNKYSSRFYPEKFLQFVDYGAIVFTNDTVGNNIIDECRRITGVEDEYDGQSTSGRSKKLGKRNQQLLKADEKYYDEEDEWENDYSEDYEDAPVHEHGTPNSEDVRPSALAKDPTKHLAAYFATTLILVIVFAIIILFGRNILAMLQPLLPG